MLLKFDCPKNDLPTCKLPTEINILAVIYHIGYSNDPLPRRNKMTHLNK